MPKPHGEFGSAVIRSILKLITVFPLASVNRSSVWSLLVRSLNVCPLLRGPAATRAGAEGVVRE